MHSERRTAFRPTVRDHRANSFFLYTNDYVQLYKYTYVNNFKSVCFSYCYCFKLLIVAYLESNSLAFQIKTKPAFDSAASDLGPIQFIILFYRPNSTKIKCKKGGVYMFHIFGVYWGRHNFFSLLKKSATQSSLHKNQPWVYQFIYFKFSNKTLLCILVRFASDRFLQGLIYFSKAK